MHCVFGIFPRIPPGLYASVSGSTSTTESYGNNISHPKGTKYKLSWQFHLPQWLIISATEEQSGQTSTTYYMAITSASNDIKCYQ